MVGLRRVFRSKLLSPVLEGVITRPRLLDGGRARLLAAQAPAGAGKSLFLAQWLGARDGTTVYYQLDEQDADGEVFAAHLLAGFRTCWPDWAPPSEAESDAAALAVELVNEAAVRGPTALVLDRLDAAYGRPYLADFLAVLVKYAPPSLSLALGTRAPLPADLTVSGRPMRVVTATDLAMLPGEASEWLGETGWEDCHAASGGLPLALRLWQETGAAWPHHLAAQLLAEMPVHVPAESGRALVEEYCGGRLPLASFAHQISQGQPGAERIWSEVQEIRYAFQAGEVGRALERVTALWPDVRSSGNRFQTGVLALLHGEAYYSRGEYGRAMEWYRQAFEAEPSLEMIGTHSLPAILKDLGQVEEAEALSRRCIAALQTRGDLQALAYAHEQYGVILTELGRLDEAEQELLEAERLGLKLSGEPFYGILAMAHRAKVYQMRGDPGAHRRIAEEAYALAKRWSPWLEAICGFILAPALLSWGEYEAANRLIQQALSLLTQMDSKWQLHIIYTILARVEAGQGRMERAREHFDISLGLAVREGYLQYLQGFTYGMELLTDALVRGVEQQFCQEVMVRAGNRALPALLELAGGPEPRGRRAVLYPLARIGGEQAVAAIRHLLYDPDEAVRDGAIVAMRSLGEVVGADGAQAAAAPVAGRTQAAPVAPIAVQAQAAAVTPVGVEPVATAVEAAAPHVQVALLGPMHVAVGGQPVQGWRTAKARDLVAYLLLAGDRPVTRDALIESLWPDADLDGGQALLHTTLYYLRRALKPAGDGLITFAGGAYRLVRERVATDLERFHRLAASGGEAAWRIAAELYRGDLVEGLDYPWVEAPRARARSAYLEVLRSLAGVLRGGGRPGEAVEWLQRLIQADPLAEEGHVGLMECYAAIGNRNAALQQYRTLVRVLDEELGLEPGRTAVELYQRLLG